MRPLTIRGGTFARPESIVSDIKDHADASVPVSKFCGMSQRTAQDLPLGVCCKSPTAREIHRIGSRMLSK